MISRNPDTVPLADIYYLYQVIPVKDFQQQVLFFFFLPEHGEDASCSRAETRKGFLQIY